MHRRRNDTKAEPAMQIDKTVSNQMQKHIVNIPRTGKVPLADRKNATLPTFKVPCSMQLWQILQRAFADFETPNKMGGRFGKSDFGLRGFGSSPFALAPRFLLAVLFLLALPLCSATTAASLLNSKNIRFWCSLTRTPKFSMISRSSQNLTRNSPVTRSFRKFSEYAPKPMA
jgi:hypothetical protein